MARTEVRGRRGTRQDTAEAEAEAEAETETETEAQVRRTVEQNRRWEAHANDHASHFGGR
jgi:hypothetical protein